MLFAGQGYQHYDMARQLFSEHARFRNELLTMDAVLRDLTGSSVCDRLYFHGGRATEAMVDLRMTHPAIFMVEYALARCVIAEHGEPDYVLGASLGSFAAAAIAGCIDPQLALAAVVRQAELIEQRCDPGHMIAVLESPELSNHPRLRGLCELASVNFEKHCVIAVPGTAFVPVIEFLRKREVAHQTLQVRYAFHSRWIDGAAAEYRDYLANLVTRSANIPLLCCANARLVTELPANYFWDVARLPIRFRETVCSFDSEGARSYIDVGPTSGLATLLKYARPEHSVSTVHPILSRDGNDMRGLRALAQWMAGSA
jgi:acyl transferase domain-containing protein